MHKVTLLTSVLLAVSCVACTQETLEIDMHALTAEGTGAKIGTITVKDSATGTEFIPNLNGVSAGSHGFHIHEAANCGPADKDGQSVPGLAAKGHFDPGNTGVHAGPRGNGHLGDLPALNAGPDGKVVETVVAPRIKTSDLKGHALIVHAKGDNYSDIPDPLGGGGARFACGVLR
ncbi:MAG: superoxide dismutase family protein [Methylococcaceae bacterium]|nr:superoxide dismutase family protein [Methylococcaceae bacterium]